MKVLNSQQLKQVAGGKGAAAAGTIGVGAAAAAGFMAGGPVGAIAGIAIAGGAWALARYALR